MQKVHHKAFSISELNNILDKEAELDDVITDVLSQVAHIHHSHVVLWVSHKYGCVELANCKFLTV